jgi:hypothetical protein
VVLLASLVAWAVGPNSGACCLYNVCVGAITESGCSSQCGIYKGDDTICGNVTCESIPQTGTITIYKNTLPTGGSGFNFTDDIQEPNSFTLDDCGSKTFNCVPVGTTYTVTEEDPALSGYGVSALSCVSAWADVNLDLSNRTISIALQEPQDSEAPYANCTFENKLLGTITVEKRKDSGCGSLLPGWEMSLYYGPDCNGTVVATGVTDSNGTVTFAVLPRGYSVAETLKPQWTNLSSLCQDVSVSSGNDTKITFVNLPYGACCYPDGTCGQTDEMSCDCASPYTDWQGEGSVCANVTCEQPSACCLPGGGCKEILSLQCYNEGGVYAGPGSTCGNETCTLGACCEVTKNPPELPAGELAQANGMYDCRETINYDCDGPWNPTLSCDDNPCDPTPGACFVDGKCENVPRIECLGDWKPGGCPEAVPTITEWGLVLLSLLMITTATWFIRKRNRTN